MLSYSIIASALLSTATLALPAAEVPDTCDAMLGDQCYEVEIGYYSDKDCTMQIGDVCEHTAYCGSATPGDYSCGDGLLPQTSPYYAKVKDAANPNVQVVYTEDQTCPPSGPGAVFATLIDNDACVEINLAGMPDGAGPGVTVFPDGGAAVSRRGNVTYLERDIYGQPMKRADTKCSGFRVDSQKPSSSQSVQVSNIVDCTNGGDSGCMITESEEHSESVTTSYSLTAGGGIEGIFEASATFGMDYTDESSTTLEEGFSVQAGQKGYLSAFSAATLFTGTYTGCDTGDAEQPGQVLAIKENGFTYIVVNTGA